MLGQTRFNRRSLLLKAVAGGKATIAGLSLAHVLDGAPFGAESSVALAAENSGLTAAYLAIPIQFQNNDGDTYYTAWTSDQGGTLYINTDDTHGFGNVYDSDTMLGKLSGDPNVPSTLVGTNINPMNSSSTIDFWTFNTTKGPDNRTWKATTLYGVDGILYKGVYRQQDTAYSVGGRSYAQYTGEWAKNASIIKSTDGGQQWITSLSFPNAANDPSGLITNPMFPGAQFGFINFVHYGQDGKAPGGAPDASDHYVYAWSWDLNGTAPGSYHNTPNGANLARCLRSDLPLLNASTWQYFSGLSGSNPTWSNSMASAKHIYEGDEVSHGDMVYNEALNLYIWLTYGGSQGRTWYIHTAAHPWGPWTLSFGLDVPGNTGLLQQGTFLHNMANSSSMWIAAAGQPGTSYYALWVEQLTLVPSTQRAYGNDGSAWPIPGKIAAEHFDTGGPQVAYVNSYRTNKGGTSSRNGTDGSAVSLEPCHDSDGGNNWCWTTTGDWLKFTVAVSSAGTYILTTRVASGRTDGLSGSFHVEVDGNPISGTIKVPNTGGWQQWTTTAGQSVSLTAGQHLVRVYVETGGFNLNWINFAASSTEMVPGNSTLLWSILGIVAAPVMIAGLFVLRRLAKLRRDRRDDHSSTSMDKNT